MAAEISIFVFSLICSRPLREMSPLSELTAGHEAENLAWRAGFAKLPRAQYLDKHASRQESALPVSICGPDWPAPLPFSFENR